MDWKDSVVSTGIKLIRGAVSVANTAVNTTAQCKAPLSEGIPVVQKKGAMDITVNGDDRTEKQNSITIWGNHNFEVDVKFIPGVNGPSKVVCNAWQYGSDAEFLHCNYVWKHVDAVNHTTVETVVTNTSVYHLSADDIGFLLLLEVSPLVQTDLESNVAYALIGPFDVNFQTHKIISDGLLKGKFTFHVLLNTTSKLATSEEFDTFENKQNKINLTVTPENIVIKDATGSGIQSSVIPLKTPQLAVRCDIKSPNKFMINSGDKQYCFTVIATEQRDTIVTAIRIFFAFQQELIDTLISGLANKIKSTNSDDTINQIIRNLTFRQNFNDMKLKLENLQQKKEKLELEKGVLEEELYNTISAFQEKLEHRVHNKDTPRTDNYDGQRMKSDSRNRFQISKNQLTEEQIIASQSLSKRGISVEAKVESTDEIRDRTREIQRLRKECEDVHFEKERLRRRAEDTARQLENFKNNYEKKSNFTENTFLHVKARYDKLLLDYREEKKMIDKLTSELDNLGKSHSNEIEHKNNQNDKLKKEKLEVESKLDTVLTERNRLSKLVETLRKDLDSSLKQFTDQEKLLINTKSHRKQLEGEIIHLKETIRKYNDANSLKDDAENDFHRNTLSSNKNNPSEVQREENSSATTPNPMNPSGDQQGLIRLGQLTHENEKLKNEVTSLKNRIKKLAVTKINEK